jgi:hypothetical protein
MNQLNSIRKNIQWLNLDMKSVVTYRYSNFVEAHSGGILPVRKFRVRSLQARGKRAVRLEAQMNFVTT